MLDLDPYRVPEIHDEAGKYQWSHAYIKKATAVQQVRALAQSKAYDVFLNLCDGAFDEDRAGQEVVDALERYGCAYTGADAVFYEPSKELMKKMAYYYDIPTPPWAFMFDIDLEDNTVALQQATAAVEGLRYPLIVKHFNGYSSVGMGKDCKVHNQEQLMQQVRKFVSQYGGALIEEFIPGREFTVLVVENDEDPEQPFALLPVECVFTQGEDFKHFELKWKEYESIKWVPLDVGKDPELDAALRRAAAAAFVSLKGCSFGRCDFRVDAQGNIYFLEINPNCGIFYPKDAMGSADIILTLDPQMKHADFIDRIIACGLARRDRKRQQQVTENRYRHVVGYGMYAARDIAPGEVVIRYEERPHVIMTRRQAARVFGPEYVPGPSPADLHSASKAGCNGYTAVPTAAANGGHSHDEHANGHAASNRHSVTSTLSSLALGDANGAVNGSQQHAHLSSSSAAAGDLTTAQPVSAQQPAECVGQHSAGGLQPGQQGAAQQALGLQPQQPVTVQLDFKRLKGEWFQAYAYPLTDEVWVTWSDNPDDWLPLNHSCDPNCWIDGLNLVARRPIKKGEHVAADYAMFAVHNMHEFKCSCGAARCRGIVRGTDYLEPWVDELYGGHVSDYVATKRAVLQQRQEEPQRDAAEGADKVKHLTGATGEKGAAL